MPMPASASPRIAIVLTATIDPGETPFLAIRDPVERLTDYRRSLQAWLTSPVEHPVVLCENSGADLAPLEATANESSKGREFELLGFDGNAVAQSKGKGAGEVEIIRHVLAESRIVAEADLVMKVSGRYYIANVETLLRRTLALGPADSYLDLWWYLKSSYSDCFLATPEFLDTHLLPRADAIDDHAGTYFEHCLAQAVLASVAQDGKWLPLGSGPRLVGSSGTHGGSVADSLPRRMLGEVRRRVALELLCHGPRGRWRPRT
jgi:hypothetical protein